MKLSTLTKHAFLIFLTFSLLTVAACTGDKKEPEKQTEEKNPDAELGKKIDPYVMDCLNRVSASVSQDYSRYTQKIDPAKGPNPTPFDLEHGMGPRPMFMMWPKIDACKQGVEEAKKAKPSVPAIEQAGEDFVKTFVSLDKLRSELKEYYSGANKAFKEDKWKKGKELHPTYMKAFNDFFAADRTLRDELDKIQQGIQDRSLARLEAKGPSVNLHLEKTMNAAERLYKTFNRTEKWDTDTRKAWSSEVASYEKFVEEGSKFYAEKQNQIAISSGKLKASLYFTYSKDFVKDLKDVTEGFKTLPGPTKAHYGKISSRYNMLVGAYNGIR